MEYCLEAMSIEDLYLVRHTKIPCRRPPDEVAFKLFRQQGLTPIRIARPNFGIDGYQHIQHSKYPPEDNHASMKPLSFRPSTVSIQSCNLPDLLSQLIDSASARRSTRPRSVLAANAASIALMNSSVVSARRTCSLNLTTSGRGELTTGRPRARYSINFIGMTAEVSAFILN